MSTLPNSVANSLSLPFQPDKENQRVQRVGKMVLRSERPALGSLDNGTVGRTEVQSKCLQETRVVPSVEPAFGVQEYPDLATGVHNIDVEDEENPQLCNEYAPFLYAYLREVEQKQPIKKDFLKNCHVTGKMRGVLIDWLIEVHHQFKLLQETLYMTIHIIDRYLQVDGLNVKRNRFQLLGVSAMFTASKVEEMYAPEINDFVFITDNAFSAAEIRQMELKLLSTLNFAINRPLPLHFLRRNSKAGDVDILQHTLAKYIIELCQVEYDLAHLAPSFVAACSLYLSLLILTPNVTVTSVWTASLEHYSSYGHMQLLPHVCKMAAILQKAADRKLNAVYTKYSSKKMLKVAEHQEIKGEMVRRLATKYLNSIK